MACPSIINVDHFVISHCFRSRLKETEVHRVTGKYKKDIHMKDKQHEVCSSEMHCSKAILTVYQRDCQILNHSD